jgi:C2H2 type zinc-finger (2 copies)
MYFLLDKQPEEYCTTMLWKQKPDGTKTEEDEKYYLLSDVLPKDKQIRDEIQKKTIETVLARHQFERMDSNYLRGCLYCRSEVEPTRYQFVEHLFSKHFLQLGKPENLIFIDELIDFIEDRLTNLVCIYCEKIFKDRPTLKEHMRKKGHKRINPENKAYDRFFMCNYKMKETPQKLQERKFYNPKPRSQPKKQVEDQTIFNSDDSDWSDWEERDQEIEIMCLFCSHKEKKFETLTTHISEVHHFNFADVTKYLSFYQKVKIVNYIRRKVHLKQCLSCDKSSESVEELMVHMTESNHIRCNESDFEKPEFFFPTFEDDSFLCHLDNNFNDEEEMSDDSGAVVISEDRIEIVNEAAEMLSREKFIEI